jgi:hypothetical protein
MKEEKKRSRDGTGKEMDDREGGRRGEQWGKIGAGKGKGMAERTGVGGVFTISL